MNTPDIIAAMKERLAEIDAEAAKLRRMIAAAEGAPVAPTLPARSAWPTYPGDVYPSPFIWTMRASTLDLSTGDLFGAS